MIIDHTTNIRVRYADTDKMGVVYNGNYLTFFEVGRTELMRSLGMTYRDFENAGFLLPLIESHVNYKYSAYYDDVLSVRAAVDFSDMSARLRFDYHITVNDKSIATGWTIHSYVKRIDMKPIRPPKLMLDLINNLKNK